MPTDKPAFLKDVDDTYQDIDSIIEPQENEEKPENTEKPVETKVEDNKDTGVPTGGSEVVGEKDAGENDKKEETGDVPAGDKSNDNPKDDTQPKDPASGEPAPAKPPENKDGSDSGQPEGKLIFGKYKTVDEAEKGYNELFGAFSRANNTIEAYRTGKMVAKDGETPELKKLIETPLIPVTKPKVQDYTSDDGTVDLERYMADYTNSLVLGIQKAFLGGSLAAVQFDIIKNSILEEHSQSINQANIEKEASVIVDKLYSEFPILKENKDVEDIVSKAFDGERMARINQSKAEGKQFVPFTYDDYRAIILKMLGARSGSGQKTEPDNVEKIRPQAVMNASPVATNEMDDIIAGMSKVTDRTQIF